MVNQTCSLERNCFMFRLGCKLFKNLKFGRKKRKEKIWMNEKNLKFSVDTGKLEKVEIVSFGRKFLQLFATTL